MNKTIVESKPVRESGIELFRIITMLIIVAHHYVVNSGLLNLINESSCMTLNSVFLSIFGWGGKIGINCFVMITGYFMCTSKITVKKFLKLFLELEFYKIMFYLIFLITGYEPFSIKALIKTIIPLYSTGFISSFLIFYLFIPFLNLLIHAMDEKMHLRLILLSVIFYSVLPTFIKSDIIIGYVTWFMVIYFIASYIRIYPKNIFGRKNWGWVTLILISLSWVSILLLKYAGKNIYYFVIDSNKFFALIISVSAFLYFKNLNLGYKKTINKIAASCFGVLLIHANSDTMRKWLWIDLLNNVKFFESKLLIIHAIGSVIIVYIVCTLIDMLRIRFIEKPLFKWIDKRYNKIHGFIKNTENKFFQL